jgi:CheY-like chemotaxis protein
MQQPSILLIDDDSDVLTAIGERCRALSYEVLTARNLLTALALVESHRPDVICADVNLPTGSGLDFCEILASRPTSKRMQLVILTGQRDAETIRYCRQLGAHYVPKQPDVWTHLKPLLEGLMTLPTNQNWDCQQPAMTAAQRRLPAADDAGRPFSACATAADSTGVPASPPIGPHWTHIRPLAGRTIVIADDDADLVYSLSQRCSQLGCRVLAAHSALETLNVVHQLRPDLVCIDVNMPGGNGLSVCEMMASDERLRAVPIIVMTGSSDHATIRRCHDMMVYYVQKNGDVWSRVEPLLVELLGSRQDQPAKRTTQPASPVADDNPLVDAVFAMLGTNDDPPLATEKPAIDEPPWVLCVDDDADFAETLKCRLEAHGVAVVRAASGMEGYRLAFARPASAILLDYNMPDGQGDYILARLQDNPVTRDIPVLIITGVRDKWLERKMYGLGAKRFMTKPIDFDSLRDELANYIDILAEPAAI